MEGRYNDPAARAAREMARRIVGEFGDPNREDYRDPHVPALGVFASTREQTSQTRTDSTHRTEANKL